MGAPQTLPANFQGWDKTAPGAPATLPANFNQWDKAEPEPTQFEKDRAVTEAWAHGHKILGPIARFLVAGGQNAASAITDTPSYLYHAITDPPTGEEVGLTPEQRVIARLGLEQATKAGMSYASGEVTPKGVASVFPEALGAGLGQVAGGAVYGKVGETVGDVAGAAGSAASKARDLWEDLPAETQKSLQSKVLGTASPRLKNALDLKRDLGNILDALRSKEAAPPPEPAEATLKPGEMTPQGWYYLGRMQELAKNIEAEEAAAAGPKNVTPSRAAALKKPVTPPASSDDLTNLLQESLKRAQAAKGLGGSLADLK